jgi:hypothetical protein
MSKQTKRQREEKALSKLKTAGLDGASALQLGTAAVSGELVARSMSIDDRTRLGLSLALRFVNSGRATATRHNRFTYREPSSRAETKHPYVWHAPSA